ncbi:hypothetical protein BH10PSE7_BH10PSE7_15350 [soil metagenome]
MARDQPWRNWYNSARWLSLRLATFLRDGYTCKRCGTVTSHLACDHIQPHRGNARLFWDPDNLQSLCIDCHDKKQKEEQSSLQRRGVWD